MGRGMSHLYSTAPGDPTRWFLIMCHHYKRQVCVLHEGYKYTPLKAGWIELVIHAIHCLVPVSRREEFDGHVWLLLVHHKCKSYGILNPLGHSVYTFHQHWDPRLFAGWQFGKLMRFHWGSGTGGVGESQPKYFLCPEDWWVADVATIFDRNGLDGCKVLLPRAYCPKW